MSAKHWLSVRNESSGPAEILIQGQIGKNWWDDSGTSEKEFTDALKAIPEGREIIVGINSEGGSVQDGLGIYHALLRRGSSVTTRIDGYAVSIASVIALAGSKRISPKSSIWMIHEPWMMSSGSAEDHRRDADALDKHAVAIVNAYNERTGMSVEEARAKMKAVTWFTGDEAVTMGFATHQTEEAVALNKLDPSKFRNIPQDILKQILAVGLGKQIQNAPQGQRPDGHTANPLPAAKEVAGGPTEPESATANQGNQMPEANPVAAPTGTANPDLNLLNRIAQLETQNATERRTRITAEVQKCANEDRIPGAQVEAWVTRAMADETVLNDLRAMTPKPPGGAPLAAPTIEANASASDIAKGFTAFNAASESWQKGNDVSMRDIGSSAMQKATFFAKHRTQIMAAAGDNTIAAGVQRQVILQEIMRAFASKILPLRAFSTVHANIPLQGTDIINVPYYDLETAASTDWNAANGYVAGETNTDTRAITINKRKYQAFSFSSSIRARQPMYNTVQIAALKAEKLGIDVFADVLSVVTAANYGAASITKVAALFTSDDVATLRGVCNTASWPDNGRALILNADYDAALTKDTGIKAALNFGGNVAQTGTIPQLFGFNYFWTNNIPANAQNLVGFAAFVSSILVATSPIEPNEDVRAVLAAYEVVVDPTTGLTFEYRRSGNAQTDLGLETIECNYGYVKGNAAAIKRIVSA